MGRVYAVASAKGGVGKTTTTANVAAALSEGGASVVVVDADLGMPNLAGAFGLDATPTIHDVLAGDAVIADAVHESAGGVAVVPGSTALDDFRAADPSGLADAVAELADEYDYVLLDSGAGLSHDSLVPLVVADEVILVTASTRDARSDTSKTREVTDRLGTTVAGVVVNRVADGDFDGLDDFVDLPVLGAVPDSPAVAAATEAGEPLVRSDPDAAASLAYRHVATALTDDGEVSVAADITDPVSAVGDGDDADDEAESEVEEADDEDEGEPEEGDEEGEVEEADDEGESEVEEVDGANEDEVGEAADEDGSVVEEEDDGDESETDEADTDGEGEVAIDGLVAEAETSSPEEAEAADEAEETEATGEDDDTEDDATGDDADELEEPGVQETALFQSRPGDDDDADDEADTPKKKGFLSRLFGLD